MILKCDNINITKHVETITWSGSDGQAARVVEFTVVYSPNDKNSKTTVLKTGSTIILYDDKKRMIFYGMLFTREKKSQAGALSYTAYDRMIHLIKCKGTYKFKNKTAEQITIKICNAAGIQAGKLSNTKINVGRVFFDNRPFYEIIMAGYTKASRKSGKQYIAMMDGSKLNIIEKGKVITGYQIKENKQITDSSYAENLDSMVNQVSIYNSSNKRIGIIRNEQWVKKYGIFQDTLSVEKGNGKEEANALLSGIEKNASISAIGNIKCISGRGIVVKDAATGLSGKYWIKSDSHTWKDGNHMMTLDLAFKNIMDAYEVDEWEKESKKTEESEGSNKEESKEDTKDSDSQIEKILNEARKWIGTVATGSNNVIFNTHYYGVPVDGEDYPWCCVFIWDIFRMAGMSSLFIGGGKTAYCFTVSSWYSARGMTAPTPNPGDLVVYGGQGHIGIVESVHNGGFTAIEGNYSRQVSVVNRGYDNIVAFCRPNYQS